MQKRRVFQLGIMFGVLLASEACHLASREDPNRPLVARIRANDASAARQLTAGFYGIENNAWRWTAGKFSVVFPVSDKAKSNGATLELKLTFPPGEIAQLGSTTLSADANGTVLPSETFSKAGESTYSQEIPVGALTGSTVRVNFALSKAMPPAAPDVRTLGSIFREATLKTK